MTLPVLLGGLVIALLAVIIPSFPAHHAFSSYDPADVTIQLIYAGLVLTAAFWEK